MSLISRTGLRYSLLVHRNVPKPAYNSGQSLKSRRLSGFYGTRTKINTRNKQTSKSLTPQYVLDFVVQSGQSVQTTADYSKGNVYVKLFHVKNSAVTQDIQTITKCSGCKPTPSFPGYFKGVIAFNIVPKLNDTIRSFGSRSEDKKIEDAKTEDTKIDKEIKNVKVEEKKTEEPEKSEILNKFTGDNKADVSVKNFSLNVSHQHKSWPKVTVFVFIPIIIVGSFITFKTFGKRRRRPDFRKYEYMRIRNKKFPWCGGSNESFFHNPQKNALPDGYEDEKGGLN